MIRLKNLTILGGKAELASLPGGKLLINTVNAHSFNTAKKDKLFAEALTHGDVLIPDGVSIVKACRWIRAKSQPRERVAGWDLFEFEMKRLERESGELRIDGRRVSQSQRMAESGEKPSLPSPPGGGETPCGGGMLSALSSVSPGGGEAHAAGGMLSALSSVSPGGERPHAAGGSLLKKVMFMGSSPKVLDLIARRAAVDYPHLEVATYSPPYKPEFSEEDNKAIIDAINAANPDLLWIGMTAPKQEKWAYSHWQELDIHCHVGTIGAVFDFYAGTVRRAPVWWQRHGLEWLYRLLREPRRMWRRYAVGNVLFLKNVLCELF